MRATSLIPTFRGFSIWEKISRSGFTFLPLLQQISTDKRELILNDFRKIYEDAYETLASAKEQNPDKKLTVLIGEEHYNPSCTTAQLIIIAAYNNLNKEEKPTLALELSQTELDSLPDLYDFKQRVGDGGYLTFLDQGLPFLALNKEKIGVDVIAADSCNEIKEYLDFNDEDDFVITNSIREKDMVKAVLGVDAPCMAIFGILHINSLGKKIQEQSETHAPVLISTTDIFFEETIDPSIKPIQILIEETKKESVNKKIATLTLGEDTSYFVCKYLSNNSSQNLIDEISREFYKDFGSGANVFTNKMLQARSDAACNAKSKH